MGMNKRHVAVFALVLVVLLGAFAWWSGALEALLVRIFGPPRVEMTESYDHTAHGEVFDHTDFGSLVADYVDSDGFVDYAGVAGDEGRLDAYLGRLAKAKPDDLGRDERLAFLINAYNAYTLKLILDHQPIDSIRDIPGDERWDAERWVLGGQTYSLNQIEHELIRQNFREPRIHFALVCAAVGCPPLRSEAYTGTQLEAQLEDQTRLLHASERWVRYGPGAPVIELTSLYLWYAGDFEQVAGSVLEYVAQYDADLATDLSSGHEPRVRHLSYDWSLNSQN